MSLDSTKQDLRKLEFPYCVKEGLCRIEQLCIANISNVERIQSIKQTDLAMELITEFVFCEVDRRGVKKRRLNRVQEMQLLEVLSDYFAYNHNSTLGGDAARNTVFMSLFPHTFTERSQFLVKLISIAICTNNIPLLSAAGVLMQQVGCTSKFSAEIAKGLVNDYFVLSPECSRKLRELPSKAPLFTANFLTALTEIYFVPEEMKEPPLSLLKVLTEWICDNASLCYTALNSNLLNSLPSGGIPMPAVTPFIGLFRWCALAPLFTNEDCQYYYAKIHLSSLESLLEIRNYCQNTTQRNVISAQHLCSVIITLNNSFARIVSKFDAENLPSSIQLSLERLGQFIQIALHMNCIYGSRQELINRLKILPRNRLLQMTISRHKEIV